jgi:AcrR family transcriptional regulator
MASRRFSRTDWLALGLRLLARHGPESLTVDRLTAAAQRTRGSLYHHFESQSDFAQALLSYWRERHTENLIAASGKGAPGDRRKALHHLASALESRVERAVRRWAAFDASAAQIVRAIDLQRVAYLADLIAAETGLARAEAADRAWLEYAGFVGATELSDTMGRRQFARLRRLAAAERNRP